jgi:hypothetical protein
MSNLGTVLRGVLLILILAVTPARAQVWPNSVPDYQSTAKGGINEAQARYLVALVARRQRYDVRAPYSFIERLGNLRPGAVDEYPGFFYLSIGFDDIGYPVQRYPLIYFPRTYYVSKMTGDVLAHIDRPPIECRRVSFPSLRKIQREIMRRTGVTISGETQQRLGLNCEVQ